MWAFLIGCLAILAVGAVLDGRANAGGRGVCGVRRAVGGGRAKVLATGVVGWFPSLHSDADWSFNLNTLNQDSGPLSLWAFCSWAVGWKMPWSQKSIVVQLMCEICAGQSLLIIVKVPDTLLVWRKVSSVDCVVLVLGKRSSRGLIGLGPYCDTILWRLMFAWVACDTIMINLRPHFLSLSLVDKVVSLRPYCA
jgi:hypothetical protein